MSFSLEFYKSRKKQLIEQLDKLQVVLQDMESTTEIKKVEAAKKSIRDDYFRVVVVGEFSRGKSTFINALLGKKMLPSSVRPTTTLLNIITYSKEPFIRLHFRGKGSKLVPEEVFNKLIAPKEPFPGDHESEQAYEQQVKLLETIEYAEIGHPLSFCEDGVQIIDTPGTNDLDPAREQLTNSIIPQSDAAILILSAIKILSESELSFLRDRILASDIQKIFIVVNQKDLLESSEQVSKVYQYAYENLQGILSEPKVFMVTAKGALNAKRKAAGEELLTKRGREISVQPLEESGFPDLESALANFLQFERGAAKLGKSIQGMEKLISNALEKQIKFSYMSLQQQKAGLQEKIAAIRPRLDQIRNSGKEYLKKVIIELNGQESTISKWYDHELSQLTAKGLETFDLNRQKSISEISSLVEKAIAPLERQLHESKKEKMAYTAKYVIEDISKQLTHDWLRLEEDLQSLGSFTNSVVDQHWDSFTPGQEPDTSLFIELFEELDTAWEQSNSFIGKLAIGAGYIATALVGITASLLRGIFSLFSGEDEKTKFYRKLNAQFEAQTAKRRQQYKNEWSAMINAVYKQYQEIVNNNILQVEEQLNVLQENNLLEEKEIKLKLAVLERRTKALREIKNSLAKLTQDLNTASGQYTHS